VFGHFLDHLNKSNFFFILGLISSTDADFDLSGSLLPDVFPEGDPSLYALPVYLEQPKDVYTARGVMAKLGNYIYSYDLLRNPPSTPSFIQF
jgi:hypothetical protein